MPTPIQIAIAEPCHENWQQMTPNEQGRFCGSCQKTVVDFSTMTDKEILDYISRASHNICGRVNDDQMNRDIKAAEHKKRFSWGYVWNLIVAMFLMTKAEAQVGKIKAKKTSVVVEQGITMGAIAMPVPAVRTQTKGVVVNAANGTPLSGASITIKDQGIGTASDSAGAFTLNVKQGIELSISCIGYESQTLLIDKLMNLQPLRIALKPAVLKLDSVVVVSGPFMEKHSMVGGLHYAVKVTKREKAQRIVSDWMPKKDVKVFPNPTVRGHAVNVSLALKKAGEYRLELMDASGKIVHAQMVQMPGTTRTVAVNTDGTWSAGIYWLRVSGKNIKNVYQSKVIIR